MSGRLDTFGYIFTGFVVVFCGAGFYVIFTDGQSNWADKIAFTSFWLAVSFLFIVYSIGINRGEGRLQIKVPKTAARFIFSLSGALLVLAVLLYGTL